MKKAVSVLLSIALLFSMTGCNNNETKGNSVASGDMVIDKSDNSDTMDDDVIDSTDDISIPDNTALFSQYEGCWMESWFNINYSGMVLELIINDDGSVSITVTDNDFIDNNIAVVAQTYEVIQDTSIYINFTDNFNNTGLMTLTFDDELIYCDITNMTYNSEVWGFYEGSYVFATRYENINDLYTDAYEYYIDDTPSYTDEPVEEIDTSKASGILQSLGMTEEEFRDGCETLFSSGIQIGRPDGTEYYYSDLIEYPNNYVNQHFVIDNISGYDFECTYKGTSDDNYVFYMSTSEYYYALIFDLRDDVFSPNITSGDKITPYVIFKGIQTIDGDDWLVFWMISVDKQ